MDKTSNIRRENFIKLIDQWQGPYAIAAKIGWRGTSMVSNYKMGTRSITEKVAREIERSLGMEEGELDRPFNQDSQPVHKPTVDSGRTVDLVAGSMIAVAEACEAQGIRLPATKMADCVSLIYADALKHSSINKDLAVRLVNLAN